MTHLHKTPENARLQLAMEEIAHVLERHDLAGGVFLVNAEEMAYLYKLDTSWNAFIRDKTTPLGIRLRAKAEELGEERARLFLRGAAWVMSAMANFGEQTHKWGEDFLAIMQRAGVKIDRNPPPIPRLEGMRQEHDSDR